MIQIWFQNKRSQEKQKRRRTFHCQNNQIFDKGQNTRKPDSQLSSNCFRNFKEGRNSVTTGENSLRETTLGDKENNDNQYDPRFDTFQLFCPLDFLLPNEMPPNVDLSSADICNGEVVLNKQNTNGSRHQVTQSEIVPGNSDCSWICL